MKTLSYLLLLVLLVFPKGNIKSVGGEKTYNYLTFYFVDNSDGSNANAINDEMADQLKETLKKLVNRQDNYFYFYGCNGQDHLTSSNITTFADNPKLKKYLKNPSKESDYVFDKKAIREYFTENPVTIKQNIEFNFYLSAYAAKRIGKEIETLPTPLLIMNELPVFLNISNLKDINIKTYIYINKEVKDELGEEKINKYLKFCREELNLDKNSFQIQYL